MLYLSVRLHEQGKGTESAQPTEGRHRYWMTEVSAFFSGQSQEASLSSKVLQLAFRPKYLLLSEYLVSFPTS